MVNKMILQGRLTRDVELTNTPNGVEVANFTVAWSKEYKETKTECFLNCIAWRQTGVFANKYFKKGQEIVVEGILSTRNYEDKQGNKRQATELTVDQIHFCGSKADGQTNNQPHSPTPATGVQPQNTFNSSDFEEIDADDNGLPF